MVDVVPTLLVAFGLIAVLRPEWIVAIDRRQKAAGTTRRPEEVEMTDDHVAFVRLIGGLLGLVGLVLASI